MASSVDPPRWRSPAARGRSLALWSALLILAIAPNVFAQADSADPAPRDPAAGAGASAVETDPGDPDLLVEVVPEGSRYRLILLDFRIHSARQLGYLTESLASLLGNRLEATGEVEVVDPALVQEALRAGDSDLSDVELRRLAQELDAEARTLHLPEFDQLRDDACDRRDRDREADPRTLPGTADDLRWALSAINASDTATAAAIYGLYTFGVYASLDA